MSYGMTKREKQKRYGKTRYDNVWKPTPAQRKLARAMGILRDPGEHSKYKTYSQEDQMRVDYFLLSSPFGKNSDYLTDANVQEQVQSFDRFKQYAIDTDIKWSGKDSGEFEVDGVTRSGWLSEPKDISKIWKHMEEKHPGGRKNWMNPKTAEEVNESGPETTFWENQVPKTIDKEITNTWGKVTDTTYTKDFSDDLTTEIVGERAEKWGLTDEQAQEIETAFIDELYGTTDADATTWGESTYGDNPFTPEKERSTLRAWDVNESYMDADGNFLPAKSDYDATWGLDLVRVYDEDLVPGSPEMIDYIAKGPIDYANYKNDVEYQKAFNVLGYNLDQEGVTDVRKATMIREARILINAASAEGDAEVDLSSDQFKGLPEGWKDQISPVMKTKFRGLIATVIEKSKKDKLYETDEDGNLLEPTDWHDKFDPNEIYRKDGDLYIDDIKQERLKDRLNDGSARYDPTEDIASGKWNKLQISAYTERDFNDLYSEDFRKTLDLPSRESFGLKPTKPEFGGTKTPPSKTILTKGGLTFRDYGSTDTSKPGFYKTDSRGDVYKVLDKTAEQKHLAKNKSKTKGAASVAAAV